MTIGPDVRKATSDDVISLLQNRMKSSHVVFPKCKSVLKEEV